MKTFIKKILLFTFVLTTLLLSQYTVVLCMDYRLYKEGITLKPTTTMVISSDSQTEVLLDPALYSNFENFSNSGNPLEMSYLRIKDLIAQNPGQIKTLLIDVSPLKLFSPRDDRMTMDNYESLFAEFFFFHRKEMSLLRKVDPAIYLPCLNRQIKEMWQTRQYPEPLYIGGYIEKNTAGYRDHYAQALKYEKERIVDFNEKTFPAESSHPVKMVRKMIAFAQENQVQVVLLTTPLHRNLRKGYDPEKVDIFHTWMTRFSHDYDIQWLNYYALEFPDTHWADANHLNVNATKPFAAMLNKDLARLKKEGKLR